MNKLFRKKSLLINHSILFFSIILVSLFAIKPYLNAKFPYTHDGENHLARFANYKIALKEGQFPPRFAPNLFNHYGYPVFNYNYPLANILSLPFSLLRLNYELTFKILVFLFVSLALFGIYKYLALLSTRKSSIITAFFLFITSPYLINLIYFRGNIGEIMSLCLLPIIFFYIEKIKTSDKLFHPIFIILLTGFLLSHNITILFATPFIAIYCLIRFKNKNDYITLFISSLISIGLSSWFIIPAIMEKNQIILDNVDLSANFASHFVTISQLLFSPLSFGFSFISSVDSISFSLGLTQIVFLILTFLLIIKYKAKLIKLNSLIILLSFFCLVSILLQLQIATPIYTLPLLNFIQFPWRMSLFFTVFISLLAGLVYKNLNFKLKSLIIFFLFFQIFTLFFIKPADYFHKNIIDYDLFAQSTTTNNENLPITFTYQDIADWRPSPDIISGVGEIKVDHWTGSTRRYSLNLQSDAIIVEPTMNFLGWQTLVNDKKTDYIDSDKIQGRIAYSLPAGKYQISTKFTQKSPARIIANTISLISFIILLTLIIFYRKKLLHQLCQKNK